MAGAAESEKSTRVLSCVSRIWWRVGFARWTTTYAVWSGWRGPDHLFYDFAVARNRPGSVLVKAVLQDDYQLVGAGLGGDFDAFPVGDRHGSAPGVFAFETHVFQKGCGANPARVEK